MAGKSRVSDQARKMFRSAAAAQARPSLDDRWSPEELLQLVAELKDEDFYGALLDLVVGHRAADAAVLTAVMRQTDSPPILNAIATSGRAPASMLEMLSRSRHRSVRDHATLGLLREEMATATDDRLREILSQHSGEDGIDIGVRLLMAAHPRTSVQVLEVLAKDDVDLVSEAARQALGQR